MGVEMFGISLIEFDCETSYFYSSKSCLNLLL